MMELRLIPPSAILTPYIKTYWYLKNDSEKEARQTIVPNGCMGLCFYRSGALDYAGLGKYRTGLGGQQPKSILIESGQVEAIGVEFQPYGVRRFFQMPSIHFYGLVCSPQELSDAGLTELEERILTANDIDTCWALLDAFFLSRWEMVKADELNFRRIQAALRSADSPTHASVGSMADTANLCPKQFRRIFAEYVGILPKGFLRLQRHQEIMTCLLKHINHPADIPSLEDLAWCYGYSNPAHLLTDFQSIMGYSPLELLKHHKPESYSWVDVERKSHYSK